MNTRSSSLIVGAALGALLLGGCQAAGTSAASPAHSADTPATAAKAHVAAEPSPSSTTRHATTHRAADDGFVMPNEVGKVLQTAQDDIQRVTGDPIFITRSQDATGQHRFQILDRDWKVCSQHVKPGATITTNQ